MNKDEEKTYLEIKNELINNEVYKKVKDYSKNRHDLMTYYNVGKMLVEAQGGESRAKYGDQLIKKYVKKLNSDLNKKIGTRILWRARKFYLVFNREKVSTLSTLSWSHYVELLLLTNNSEIYYYMMISKHQNLSVRQLRQRIKSNEYERLPIETRNKLINQEQTNVTDLVKNPIIIKNNSNKDIVSEKILQQLILNDIPYFLEELGNGFTFIKNEYKIKLGDRYNYIDLLLYNYIYNSFIVIELKVTELKKEHIGQIQTYMNYIEKNIKTINQNKTIGIIICKKDNKFVMEYCSDERILSREYVFM